MNYTVTQQRRQVVRIEGTQKWEVTIEVTDAGDLPTTALFVLEIEDVTDPKEDTLARVAEIADLTDLSINRNTAVQQNDTLYRVTACTTYYDSLATAVAAQDVFKERLDELTQDWATYQTQFYTVSEITNHPRYDTSIFETLVAAYETAVAAQTTAETTRDTAKTDYDTAKTAADTASTAVTTAATLRDQFYLYKGYFQNLYDAMKAGTGFYQDAETFRTAADNYQTATTGADPTAEGIYLVARDTFVNKQRDANSALTVAAANLSTFTTECASRDTAVTEAETAKATADTTLARKSSVYADAQAAYEAAQSATEAALAAVRALDPSYTP